MRSFLLHRHLNIDARAAFGVNRISSIILKVDDPASIAGHLWPRGYKDKGEATGPRPARPGLRYAHQERAKGLSTVL